jgi:hypothetical protein
LTRTTLENRLQDAQQRWQTGTGTSRFAAQIEAGLQNKLIDVEYEFMRTGETIRAHLNDVCVTLDEPIGLAPVTIAKPWGKEIWYTGMEARGESSVETQTGSLPLSHYLALAPERLYRRRPIVLAKILAPHADPARGDLYLEIHETKQEVYVVTELDPSAWPDEVGTIRLGINQQARKEFTSDNEFRAGYLSAVKAYERVRRRIDDDLSASGTTDQRTRLQMNKFTNELPLYVGDVVRVPRWQPHSLQHGVQVVEFQTPTYERRIISFGQPVLTQSHWDSEYAIARLDLEPPAPPQRRSRLSDFEQIADFEDFSAWRVAIDPGKSLELPLAIPYAVCLVVEGTLSVNGLERSTQQACFVPGPALPVTLRNNSPERAVCLTASVRY